MFPALKLLLFLLALGGVAAAAVPRKPTIRKYTKLWTDSPFTAKPIIEQTPEENILEDYSLIGVSPIAGGYRVTLINKKKPTDPRITVDSDRANKEGFKILAVTRKTGDPLGTVVRMSTGSKTGTIAFEEKFLALKAAPVQKAKAQAPQTSKKNANPPVPIKGKTPVRQPRPRVVPPPARR